MNESLQKLYERAIEKLTRNARSFDEIYLEEALISLRDEILALTIENKEKEPTGNKYYDDLLERHGSLLNRYNILQTENKEKDKEIERLKTEINLLSNEIEKILERIGFVKT